MRVVDLKPQADKVFLGDFNVNIADDPAEVEDDVFYRFLICDPGGGIWVMAGGMGNSGAEELHGEKGWRGIDFAKFAKNFYFCTPKAENRVFPCFRPGPIAQTVRAADS